MTPLASAATWLALGVPGSPGGLGGATLKVAVTAVAPLTVTVHAPVPEQAPLQLAKTEPAAGAAVRVTAVTGVTDCEQVAPQLMPVGCSSPYPYPCRSS